MAHLIVVNSNPPTLVTGADAISLYGVFGYASIDVHEKWMETPEGRRAGEASKKNLRPGVEVPGVDPGIGYFHVEFYEV
jgi:hypothetical protein